MTQVLEAKLVKRCGIKGKRKWKIAEWEHGGRGVFATCDILPGELIFTDLPILTGPKLSCDLIACTTCSAINRPLKNCSRNCHLPFCSEQCENDESHANECQYLQSLDLKDEEWSPHVYRAVTLIRSLLMSDDDKEITKLLHANRGKQVDIQVSSLLSLLGNALNEQEVLWLRHCCGVLDGTAFEIEIQDTTNTLKGLFPLSAVMNHSCVPNTRHFYTDRANGYRMLVVAAQFVAEGTQILTSYCPLLWATNLRRTFLLHTKHFQCTCERCRDPTEFGTALQAVKCSCDGVMLPEDSLNFTSEWKCDSCGERRNAKYNINVQKSLKNISELAKHLPASNYIFIQLKIENIFKKTTENLLKGLAEDELKAISQDCVGVLKTIEQLKLGETRFKGRICNRLENIAREMKRRAVVIDDPDIEDLIECGKTIETQDLLAKSAVYENLRRNEKTSTSTVQ